MSDQNPARVDLRSDTVTTPTPAMLQAMIAAPVGDDVLGDDPTVQALERKVADLLGKEAAVFVPSGTMGNQIAIAAHTNPGDSILAEDEAHILYYEVGAPAVLNGLLVRSLPSDQGRIDPRQVTARALTGTIHTPGTTLLCLENTHNRHGGSITPPDLQQALHQAAREKNLRVHLDGARLLNATVALGVPPADVTQWVDSVSLCLSKGLGAPVGSVLAADQTLIDKARVWRKRLGGGMRQAGLLAAAGIYALDHHLPLLAQDHANARLFAESLQNLPGLQPQTPETNIVMVETTAPAQAWADRLAAHDIHCFPFAPHRLRFVFHHQISQNQTRKAAKTIARLAVC